MTIVVVAGDKLKHSLTLAVVLYLTADPTRVKDRRSWSPRRGEHTRDVKLF